MTTASLAHLEEHVNSIAINLWRNEELLNNLMKWDTLLSVAGSLNR